MLRGRNAADKLNGSRGFAGRTWSNDVVPAVQKNRQRRPRYGKDGCQRSKPQRLQARENDTALRLILALLVFVARFAILFGLEEDDLAESLIGIDFRGKRRGIADFERDETFPFGLKRRHVDDDSAARVSGFSDANRQHVARDAEILDGAGQRER